MLTNNRLDCGGHNPWAPIPLRQLSDSLESLGQRVTTQGGSLALGGSVDHQEPIEKRMKKGREPLSCNHCFDKDDKAIIFYTILIHFYTGFPMFLARQKHGIRGGDGFQVSFLISALERYKATSRAVDELGGKLLESRRRPSKGKR